MLRRFMHPIGLLTIGLLLVVTAVMWPNPGAAPKKLFVDLSRALNQPDPNYEEILASYARPELEIRIPDQPGLAPGRRAVLGFARRLTQYKQLSIDFSDLEVQMFSESEALVRGVLEVTLDDGFERRTDSRRFDAKLVKNGGWKLERIDVAAPTNEQPEARP